MKNVSTTALSASLVISSSPAKLIRITGTNSKASTQYIQVHDAASLPADTAVPKITMPVPADTPFMLEFNDTGRNFDNGIVVCNSSTEATKTLGSADCWFDAQVVPVDGDANYNR